MLLQFFSIGFIMLMAVILPGPDFALVTKNTISHGRRAGVFTAIGVSLATIVHMSYCILGLGIIISESLFLFNIIKYFGAAYLIFLGINALRTQHTPRIQSTQTINQKKSIADVSAFKQGFLCNLLNPKATLFFLALFTVVIKPGFSWGWKFAYMIEMVVIALGWFISLVLFLSHPRIMTLLDKIEIYIAKTLGIFLIGFGLTLALMRK